MIWDGFLVVRKAARLMLRRWSSGVVDEWMVSTMDVFCAMSGVRRYRSEQWTCCWMRTMAMAMAQDARRGETETERKNERETEGERDGETERDKKENSRDKTRSDRRDDVYIRISNNRSSRPKREQLNATERIAERLTCSNGEQPRGQPRVELPVRW